MSRVRFTPASPTSAAIGLLGFVELRYGGLQLDGIAVRWTRADELALSFPCRRDARGRKHPIVRPLGPREREEIERAVLAQLGALEGLP